MIRTKGDNEAEATVLALEPTVLVFVTCLRQVTACLRNSQPSDLGSEQDSVSQ